MNLLVEAPEGKLILILHACCQKKIKWNTEEYLTVITRSIGPSDKQNGIRYQFLKDGDRTSVPNLDMIMDTLLLDAEKLGIQDNG